MCHRSLSAAELFPDALPRSSVPALWHIARCLSLLDDNA
jgi:hypothetical protein